VERRRVRNQFVGERGLAGDVGGGGVVVVEVLGRVGFDREEEGVVEESLAACSCSCRARA
jgi:hypothetical protein